jgi:hypothetical protein
MLRLVLQDPLGIGRSSNDNANARSMAMACNSLAKVLAALRHSAPAGGAAAAPSAASALANSGLAAAGQQQHVPWRDSPLTRWLQERLHAATAITMLGTVSASTEVGGCAVFKRKASAVLTCTGMACNSESEELHMRANSAVGSKQR